MCDNQCEKSCESCDDREVELTQVSILVLKPGDRWSHGKGMQQYIVDRRVSAGDFIPELSLFPPSDVVLSYSMEGNSRRYAYTSIDGSSKIFLVSYISKAPEISEMWNAVCKACGKPAYHGVLLPECSDPDCEANKFWG